MMDMVDVRQYAAAIREAERMEAEREEVALTQEAFMAMATERERIAVERMSRRPATRLTAHTWRG